MYRAIIIDDEEMARTLLSGMITMYCPGISVEALCKDLPTGIKAIRKHKPHIVFLDIEMPGHSGLELLDFFDEQEVNFDIIFVTAYNRYAIQAFKLSAVDYLLKPVEAEDLQTAVSLFEKEQQRSRYHELKNNLKAGTPKKIGLHGISSVTFVEVDDILYFRAEGSYTKVYLKSGTSIMTSKSLKHFENTLSEHPGFYRCHKSYIVNIRHITAYVKSDGGYLQVYHHEISLSPDKVHILLEKLEQ